VLRNKDYESLLADFNRLKTVYNDAIEIIPTTNFWENLSSRAPVTIPTYPNVPMQIPAYSGLRIKTTAATTLAVD